jgi:hypothetical protein
VTGEVYTVTFGMFSIFGTPANSGVALDVAGSDLVDDGNDDGDSSDEVTIVTGTYVGTDIFDASPLTVVVDATTVTFNYVHPKMGSSSVVATYKVVDGEVVLYDEDGNTLHPMSGILEIDANGKPVSASYNGNDYTLAVKEAEEEAPVTDPALEAVKGSYSMDGYDVIIYGGEDYEGAYFFNAFGGDFDIYYTVTAVDNGDGTYTLALSLEDDSEDAFGFLTETFVVTVDGEDHSMTGPSFEVPVVDYEDITLGTTNVDVTLDMIEYGDPIRYDFVVTELGYYTVSNNIGLFAAFINAEGESCGYDAAVLVPGTYIIQFTLWYAEAGEAEINIAYTALDDISADQALDAFSSGVYVWEGDNMMIYDIDYTDDGVSYRLNIYDDAWTRDIYYIVECTANGDGTFNLALTLDTDMSTGEDYGLGGMTLVASFDNGWVFTLA